MNLGEYSTSIYEMESYLNYMNGTSILCYNYTIQYRNINFVHKVKWDAYALISTALLSKFLIGSHISFLSYISSS